MFGAVELVIIIWVIKTVISKEYRMARDHSAARLARAHPDWHPRKVARAASRRTLSHWLHEMASWPPFPSFRAQFAEDRMAAKVAAAEARAAGEVRWRDLRERLERAQAAAGGHGKPAGDDPDDEETLPPAAVGSDSAWLAPGDPRCEACGGTGADPDRPDACPACLGWGSAPAPEDSPELAPGTICAACGNPGTVTEPVIETPGGTRVHRSHVDEERSRYRDELDRIRRRAGLPPLAGDVCMACGTPAEPGNPLVNERGYRVHRSHTTNPATGAYDPEAASGAADAAASSAGLGLHAHDDPPFDPPLIAPIDDAVIAADHGFEGEYDPFPEPEPDDWPTGIPHRRNGDDRMEVVRPGTLELIPGPDGTSDVRLRDWEFRDPDLPADARVNLGNDGVRQAAAGYTLPELHGIAHGPGCTCPLSRAQFTPEAAASPSPATNGGTVTDTDVDTALEGADTPHEAMQGAFRQIGARAAQFAQAASDELAAAAAVHGMDRDPQTMADITALADHAQALQAQANSAAAGLASRHADGAEYHSTGTDADASAYRRRDQEGHRNAQASP